MPMREGKEPMACEAATARARLLHQELQRFITIVAQQLHPECIVLFGSVAAGQVREWSDLDLVVIADTTLPFYERIKTVLRSVRPVVGMDVLVYTPTEWEAMQRERPFIQEEILRKGKVVYARAR
jgi:predicted nucleotidyltransferase